MGGLMSLTPPSTRGDSSLPCTFSASQWGTTARPTCPGLTFQNSNIKHSGGKGVTKESKVPILSYFSVISVGKIRFETFFLWFGTNSIAHSIHK